MRLSAVYKNVAICGPDFAQQHFVLKRMGSTYTDAICAIDETLVSTLGCKVNHIPFH